MAKDELFKTVSFGGYDKAVVDDYIAEMNRSHQSDIADLKTTIGKLSETVRALQVAKEQVKTTASEDIEKLKLELESSFEQNDAVKHQLEDQTAEKEGLKTVLDEKAAEIAELQQQLDERIAKCIELTSELDKQKQMTEEAKRNGGDQLEAMRAAQDTQVANAKAEKDAAVEDLKQEYEAKIAEIQAQQSEAMNTMKTQYEDRIIQVKADAEEQNREYAGMRQELEAMREKETSFAGKYEAISKTLIEARERADKVLSDAEEESQKILAQANAEKEALISSIQATQEEKLARTEAECDELLKVTKDECRQMLADTENQVAIIRQRVQAQCDNVNTYMEKMMTTIDNLATACSKTKEIVAVGFSAFTEEEEAAVTEVPTTDKPVGVQE